MPKQPTRQRPYKYTVTFLCRDGLTKSLGVDRLPAASRLYTDLTKSLGVLSVEIRGKRGDLLLGTRDSTCAWCGATIGGQSGRLMLDELPFCGTCAKKIEIGRTKNA